jgi:hypothetical protein
MSGISMQTATVQTNGSLYDNFSETPCAYLCLFRCTGFVLRRASNPVGAEQRKSIRTTLSVKRFKNICLCETHDHKFLNGQASLHILGHWPKNAESPRKRNSTRFHKEPSMASVLEKLKALDAQRAQLLEGPKKEALDNAEKAVAELNELGFHYTLTEGGASTSTPRARIAPAKTQASKRQARDLPCPICEFKTTPHHDGRMHRSQKTKHPFSVEELMERHLAKVG